MVLLKRNLEGPRVHSYTAACTADLQELHLSQSGGPSAVLIRRRRCRNSTYANWYLVLAMEYYCNEGSW
jgi:hypothetical protein